jgi:hypothetical protein
MNRKFMMGIGAVLVVVGVIALASSVLGLLFGFRIWRLWPLIIITAGLLVTAPAVFVRNRRGLGALYVLGLPIITTGVLLLFAGVFRWRDVWSILWPLEVLSVAVGSLLAAVKAKAHWLLVPAIIIGANGLILQFCAITGWWHAWAVLWAVEPVAVGISLLTLNTQRPSRGLLTTGLVFCAIGAIGSMAGVAIVSLSALRPLWWLLRWLAPATVILVGAGLVFWGTTHKGAVPNVPVPAE